MRREGEIWRELVWLLRKESSLMLMNLLISDSMDCYQKTVLQWRSPQSETQEPLGHGGSHEVPHSQEGPPLPTTWGASARVFLLRPQSWNCYYLLPGGNKERVLSVSSWNPESMFPGTISTLTGGRKSWRAVDTLKGIVAWFFKLLVVNSKVRCSSWIGRIRFI